MSAHRVLLISTPEIPVPPRLYGGIERVVANLARWLVAAGVEVGLVAKVGSGVSEVPTFFWPHVDVTSKARQVDMWRHLRKAAVMFRPDTVHNFSRTSFLAGLIGTGQRVIQTYGVRPGHKVRPLRILLGRDWTFTACSDYLVRQGKRIVGGNWTRIYNCVDLPLYDFQPAAASDAPLVFLSRVDAIKGADLAIAVAKRTRRRLILAGNVAASGPNAEFFKRTIAPQLSAGEVEYIGPVDDRQKNMLLGQAAALLVPVQWDEPFGIVFIEALACGTPVLSCPRGALPELVKDGHEGFLARTVDEFCDAVSRLGEIDRSACRRKAEEFSVPNIMPQYLNLYRRTRDAEQV